MKEKKTTKNERGRPSTLTKEIADLIIDYVREDLSIKFSSNRAGISDSTVKTWIIKGKEDLKNEIDSLYADFTTGIEKARAEFVHESITQLKEDKAWQAKSWLLERCCPDEFGKDSELYKQLLDDYKMLMQSLVDQNKGVNHGRKVDPESKD